ncbi:hypothetical protein [uncultured Microscilla sp.]|uniref:hypothetical protein n=1 Tax=uncultured Microscilla sp. TaxID=432653 RepID=UPI002636E6C0|nr:hypothetical protein [uncultured Microscilla sp.]
MKKNFIKNSLFIALLTLLMGAYQTVSAQSKEVKLLNLGIRNCASDAQKKDLLDAYKIMQPYDKTEKFPFAKWTAYYVKNANQAAKKGRKAVGVIGRQAKAVKILHELSKGDCKYLKDKKGKIKKYLGEMVAIYDTKVVAEKETTKSKNQNNALFGDNTTTETGVAMDVKSAKKLRDLANKLRKYSGLKPKKY